MIIDGTNAIIGRVATFVAKRALLGENMHVVNCERMVFSGKRAAVLNAHKAKIKKRNPLKGPFYSRRPDLHVKRVIKGMLPTTATRGRLALKRVRCHLGVPVKFMDKELLKVDGADGLLLRNASLVKLSDICRVAGGKF